MISRFLARRGFTLLEILLVIMVIGIAAAAFLPVALHTAENARTRSAMREIIALNRYARSRAILDRKPMAVVYQTASDRLQLLSLPVQRDLEGETLFATAIPSPESDTDTTVSVLRDRPLPKFVRVRRVEGAEQENDGYFVIYNENGGSVSHTVEVAAPNGDLQQIHINGLTGEIDLE